MFTSLPISLLITLVSLSYAPEVPLYSLSLGFSKDKFSRSFAFSKPAITSDRSGPGLSSVCGFSVTSSVVVVSFSLE